MSSQKGNAKRSRPQKYQNHTAFKNSLHDTSQMTKVINSLEVTGCCPRCTEVIEWKIKYKKYKPLTTPKKCVRCGQKTVKKPYCIMCQGCCEKEDVCAKCGEHKDIVAKPGLTAAEEASQRSQLDQELKALPERQRRAFFRLQASGKLTADGEDTGKAGSSKEAGASGDVDCDSEGEMHSDLGSEEGSDLERDLEAKASITSDRNKDSPSAEKLKDGEGSCKVLKERIGGQSDLTKDSEQSQAPAAQSGDS